MNRHANKKHPAGRAGTDVETLLSRNLPEVFGEGDPARRMAAKR